MMLECKDQLEVWLRMDNSVPTLVYDVFTVYLQAAGPKFYESAQSPPPKKNFDYKNYLWKRIQNSRVVHMGFVMEKVADTLVLCYQLPFYHCTIFVYHLLGSGRIWPIYDKPQGTQSHSTNTIKKKNVL
jgi:hypothetical protein